MQQGLNVVMVKAEVFVFKYRIYDLENNNIGQRGIRYLASNDKLYKNLVRLILSGNKIGNKGV